MVSLATKSFATFHTVLNTFLGIEAYAYGWKLESVGPLIIIPPFFRQCFPKAKKDLFFFFLSSLIFVKVAHGST